MNYPIGQLVQGLTYEQYAGEPGLRNSHLKLMNSSPADYKYKLEHPDEPTEALLFGAIFHKAIENTEKFLDTYKVEPDVDRRTKEGKEKVKEFQASSSPGDIILKPKWVEPITGMLKSLTTHKLISNLLRTGVKETSLWAQDEETGLIVKCRPDFIAEAGYMVDVKTSVDPTERAFLKAIFGEDFFYALQAAHYVHCARMAGRKEHESFSFIAVEKTPPYKAYLHVCDSGVINAGEEWRSYLTKKFAKCEKENVWDYPQKAIAVQIPQWFQSPPAEDM